MGRHTKDLEDGVPVGEGPRRLRGIGKVPLLPAVSGVVAIGAVVSALSTQQIALNFAGGPPPRPPRTQPEVGDSPSSGIPHGRRAARDDSPLTPRGGRVSRGADRSAVTVAVRTVSTWDAGFRGQATITNRTGRTVRGWTLILRYPRTRIVSVWNARVIETGDTLVADNPAAHPAIPPGRSVKVSFTAKGRGIRPVACSFNGVAC